MRKDTLGIQADLTPARKGDIAHEAELSLSQNVQCMNVRYDA